MQGNILETKDSKRVSPSHKGVTGTKTANPLLNFLFLGTSSLWFPVIDPSLKQSFLVFKTIYNASLWRNLTAAYSSNKSFMAIFNHKKLKIAFCAQFLSIVRRISWNGIILILRKQLHVLSLLVDVEVHFSKNNLHTVDYAKVEFLIHLTYQSHSSLLQISHIPLIICKTTSKWIYIIMLTFL